jgi:transitional endoplasmic reticulum ATPase
MDDSTLNNLKAAYLLTPQNTALLAVLLDAYLARGEAEAGYALLAQQGDVNVEDLQQRRLMARVCVAARHCEESLRYLTDDAPETLILKARALVELGRNAEAGQAYARAVALNPALEDKSLEARFTGQVRETVFEREGRPRLRVIANDDTAALEATRLVEPEIERITFADVGGLDEVKEQIRRKIILPFQKPSLFQRFRKKAGGGVLLYGPPGCGKTMLARATAGECNARFHNVAIADVLDMYIGESERKLHAIFEEARRTAPSIVFFDEIEALGGKRQYSREATSAKLVSQFLAEMDGFAQNNAGVLVMGATNVPWAVDPAFRRPGRFDRVQFVPPPDRGARDTILELLLRDRPLASEIDTPFLVQHTSGFSGADLRNLVETAVEQAIEESIDHEREVPLSDAHLRGALKTVKPTTLEWLTSARNYARYANESGQYDEVLAFLDKHGRS